MARKARLEYEGAVYHVMNRGDRGGKVFRDRLDYELFLNATGEVCKRTGWQIHAYVLLSNHFHFLLETPEANLVAGMKWFLGAYSQRFNARHGQRGHVFQGRYKAVVIEADSGNYFTTASSYIHLNPVRARILEDPQKGLRQYPWSSYAQYLEPRSKRVQWLRTDRVLGNFGLRDTSAGRRAYERQMEQHIAELRNRGRRKAQEAEWNLLRHGWYVGSEDFREKLMERIAETVEGNDRASYAGGAICAHDQAQAETLLRRGMKVLKLTEASLRQRPKNDPPKCVLAWLVHTHTMASHKWIGERLHMGHPSQISTHIARTRAGKDSALRPLVRQLATLTQRKKD